MASLLLLWIHILCAIYWIGGMLFLTLVLAPVFRSVSSQPQEYLFFQKVAKRFRKGVWFAVLLLLITGGGLLSQRISLEMPFQHWPVLLQTKICLVVLLVVLAGVHDVFLGPRLGVLRQKPKASLSETEQALLKWSPWLARGMLVVGIAVVCTGTAISRG